MEVECGAPVIILIFSMSLLGSESKDGAERLATIKAIKKIHDVAGQVACDIKTRYATNLGYAAKCMVQGNMSQTKQGLFLVNVGLNPTYLMTPWGKVDLYKNSPGNVFSAAMSSALLFQKLNIKFAECPQLPNRTRPDCYEVLLDEEKQEFSLKQLSEEDYKAAQGTNKIIKCVHGAIYTIEKIGDIELPKPIYRSLWDYINEEKAKRDFKEEMKIASEWETIFESEAR